MAKTHQSGKLAVILHADVAGSTELVQRDERLAHDRIQEVFRRFSDTIKRYNGRVHELRGDALLAEFARASDAVIAALAFQLDQADYLVKFDDDILPKVRIGIAMGEIIIADNTLTGAGVVLAQRVEQLAESGGVCITAALHEALPNRLPFDMTNLGEQELKGFDETIRVHRVELRQGESIPDPETRNHQSAQMKTRKRIKATAVLIFIVAVGVLSWSRPWAPKDLPVLEERGEYSLPDKPSIAVLPFSNMSGNPEQEYFSDGMTHIVNHISPWLDTARRS
jgi:class 3 adenylate cyclase